MDGRLNHHMVIDLQNPKAGLQELRYIDPRQIRKVKGVHKVKDPRTGLDIVVNIDEFYLYNPMGILNPSSYQGIPIATDAISHSNSGIISKDGHMLLGYLHKAIRPLNQLKMMEDAVVIYRITRAPERRVFYIDVGNLPTARAERYVRDMMERFKNRLVYNAITGEAGDDRRYMAMQEDFWLPRREGGKGTQIDQLEGGKNLSDMEDVEYFHKALYKSLNIPISRLDPNNGFNLGRATEITRDEIDFQKFINKLRDRFSVAFQVPLRAQLILKGIASEKGWEEIEENLVYEYASDSYFSELKHAEVMRDRLDLLEKSESYIGRYYSHEHIRKNVLQQTDEEIEEIDTQIANEQTTGMFSVRAGKVVPDMPDKVGPDRDLDGDGEPDGNAKNTSDTNSDGDRDPSSTKYGIDDSPSEDTKEKNTGGGNKSVARKKIRAGRIISSKEGAGNSASP